MFLLINNYRINFEDVSYYQSEDDDKETSFTMRDGKVFYLNIPVKEVDDFILKFTKHTVMQINKGEE